MRIRTAGRILGIVVVITLSLTATADAQGLSASAYQNWNFLGMGARARGMGGAFLGVSNDGTAGTWNPAGLIYNEGISLAANYSLSRVSLGLDNTPTGLAQIERERDNNLTNLSAASFISPLTLREHEFYLTAYYNRVQNVFSRGEFNVDDADLDAAIPRFGTPFSTTFEQSGNLAMIGAGFGTVISGNLTMGLTLNLATGDGVESHAMRLDSTRYSVQNPLAGAIDTLVWTDKSDINYSGMNITLGAMYKTDRWSAGMVFTPGWTLTQNLDYFGQRVEWSDNTPVPSLVIVPGPDGTNREIQMPYTVGLGGAYNVTENLLLAMDYQFRAYKREGEFRYEDDPVTPESPLEVLRTDWYNLHQVRIGVEYLREMDFGVVPIRLGLRNDPMLIGDQSGVVSTYDQRAGYFGPFPPDPDHERQPNELSPRGDYFLPLTSSSSSGDQINLFSPTITVGSGVHWSQIHLDFSLEFSGFSYDESGELRMIRRCDDCRATDPKLARDFWGNRATDEFGTYSRTYEDNRLQFSFLFTGFF